MPRRPPMKTVSKEIDLFNRSIPSVITSIMDFCSEHEVPVGDAYLEFECEDYYGSSTHKFNIYAPVPKTKDEIKAERAEQRALVERRKSHVKDQLAALKKQFPDEFDEVASDG